MLAPLDLANGQKEGAQSAVVHDSTNAPAGDMQRSNALARDLRFGEYSVLACTFNMYKKVCLTSQMGEA